MAMVFDAPASFNLQELSNGLIPARMLRRQMLANGFALCLKFTASPNILPLYALNARLNHPSKIPDTGPPMIYLGKLLTRSWDMQCHA